MVLFDRRLFRIAVLPALVAVALSVSACGQSGGSPVIAGGDTPSAGSEPDAGGTTDTGSAGGNGQYDESRTVALNMKVRVVNLFIPAGADTGSPIDVWNGDPKYGGKKLKTVPYGQVSDYFAPEVPDTMGQGVTDEHLPYTLTFYLPGKIADGDSLGRDGEDSSPGQQLTLVLTPGDKGTNNSYRYTFTDDLGTAKDSSFTRLSVPTPPRGKAVLFLGATALLERGASPGDDPGLAPTSGGKCVNYFESSDIGTTDAPKLHDPASYTMSLLGGTSTYGYVLDPGASFAVSQVQEQQSAEDACATTPAVGPFDPKLAAGARAYGFLYGPNLKAAKLLVVPTG